MSKAGWFGIYRDLYYVFGFSRCFLCWVARLVRSWQKRERENPFSCRTKSFRLAIVLDRKKDFFCVSVCAAPPSSLTVLLWPMIYRFFVLLLVVSQLTLVAFHSSLSGAELLRNDSAEELSFLSTWRTRLILLRFFFSDSWCHGRERMEQKAPSFEQ